MIPDEVGSAFIHGRKSRSGLPREDPVKTGVIGHALGTATAGFSRVMRCANTVAGDVGTVGTVVCLVDGAWLVQPLNMNTASASRLMVSMIFLMVISLVFDNQAHDHQRDGTFLIDISTRN
jgi:hypothetical protein